MSPLLHHAMPKMMAVHASMAAGAVDVDFDITVLVQMLAFALLIVVLRPLLFDPMMKVFEERERRTDGAKVVARHMDEQAGELLQRYDAELEKVRKVAGEERERLRAEAQKVEARIASETRDDVAKILKDGRSRIATEGTAIRAAVRANIPAIASQVASRALGREVA